MQKFIRYASIGIFITVFVFFTAASDVFAASGVAISGGDAVKNGEIFTVTVSFNAQNIGRVDGQLTYDTDRLEYISGGTSSGNSGYIQLSEAGTGEAITFNIRFKAVADGETSISVSTNDVYDLDEMEMSPISGSKNISITGDAEQSTESEESAESETAEIQTTSETNAQDAETAGGGEVNATAVLAAGAAVVIVLLVIVAAVLRRGKSRRR